MKFTLSWLKDHLETQASLSEIVDKLTAIGLEVEEVDDRSRFAPFLIAKVVSAEKHPQADKLQILQVDYGAKETIQVVCGAPNARTGLVGVFAPSGTYIPGTGIQLAATKIRGVESHGMMCSERELELSDNHDGIIELPSDLDIGSSYAAWRDLNDPLIDVALTPNRPDCASVRGIARDLAASGLGKLKQLEHFPKSGNRLEENQSRIDVKLEFDTTPPLCSGFAWRQVNDVKNTSSPQWLRQRLTAIGLRPINKAVDITNYITHDLGRPLHVFDADKIKDNLVVRRAHQGETLLALDGKTYQLDPSICVIADAAGVQSIAGIIGGEQTGCDENTTNIIIESALWNPTNIAATGRKLGIVSDARYRFERGVDPEFAQEGLEIATKMLLDLCGGQATPLYHVGFSQHQKKQIIFSLSQIKRLTSLELETTLVEQILRDLGFSVQAAGDNQLNIHVPSWRPDIEGQADLVEEILRIHGVDKIAPQPLPRDTHIGTKILSELQLRTRSCRRALAARGMLEAINYSFISERAAHNFGGGSACLKLANPIAAEMSDMRPSLLPGLLLAAQNNANRGYSDCALFEIGDIYQNDTPQGQRKMAGAIRRGTAKLNGAGRHWQLNSQPVDIYDAKADLVAILAACGFDADKLPLETTAPSYYHPGRSGTIRLGKIIIAHFGEFHPAILEELDVSGPLCGFELFIDNLPQSKKRSSKTRSALLLSPLQMVRRDFAFIVDDKVNAATIIRAAAGADKKLIHSVEVFDIYKGTAIDENKKSLAIEVTLAPFEHSLTETQIDALSAKIIKNVIESTGGTLRQ